MPMKMAHNLVVEGAWAVAVRAQGEAVDSVLPLGLEHQLAQLGQRQET